MEFFASADQFQQLETAAANGAARSFAPLLSLAWQLRQRDTARALKLADEVAAALANAGLSDAERCRSSARLQLIKAEACWLRGQTESAQAPLDAAFAGFGAIDDHTGVGDAYWLAAFLAQNQGATEQRDRALASALSHYDLAGETLRRAAVQARMVFHAAFRDPLAAAKQWETLGTTGEQDHPLIQAWRMAARGVIHALGGRQTEAVRAFLQAHEAALACGNLNLAGNCANNAADAFAQSNELAAALEWSEHGLAIGRRIDNPSLIAAACSYLGNCLRQLGRLDEARARLNEALSVLVRIPNSPSHLTVYNYLAELALDAGDDAAALSWSSQCEIRAISAKRREQQTISLRLQARALGHLGQTEAALEKVNASLALGRESANAQWQIDALCTLAELHRQHPLPAPEGMTAATAALHYAEQALAIAASRHDLATPPQLLEDAANDYAQLGLHQNAYDLLKLAGKLREDTRRKEAIARAMAMQVRHELNQVQGEMLRQREQSAAEAERLALLERTNSTLEVLGVIGREITGK
ncbi:tetratricopeptide repeat protein, partial [Chitinimonas sp.]|uniref:tetratricopeptide repeat protein n=1 Tax=Chitinimonas sp. TaxID=1934313 RepID=UPI0035B1117B